MSLWFCWIWIAVLACSSADETPCRAGTERGNNGYCEIVETEESPETVQTPTDSEPEQERYDADTASYSVDVQYAPPEWNQGELETKVNGLFRENFPQAAPIFDLWKSMFEGRDSTCPGSGYNIQVPMSGCITSSGWRYTGPASFEVIETPMEDTVLLNADTHIIDDEDQLMIFVGTAAASQVADLGVAHWKIDLRGMIRYAPSDRPWIANGTSMLIYGGGDVGGRADLIAGWSTGDTVVSLDIQRQTDCEGISGKLWIQDPAGPRHTLQFSCTECATWTWEDGSTLGEACINQDALSDWMDSMGTF